MNSVFKITGVLIFVASAHSTPVFAQNVVAVVSDIHLMFGDPGHPNQQAFDNFLKIMKDHPEITDIIVNGDIYHGPTVARVERQQRIKMVVDVLHQLHSETNAQVHFNVGNHDQQSEHRQGQSIVDETYSVELKAAIEKSGVPVIGIDPLQIYEYKIGNNKFLISHHPFATSETMIEQAERFSWNKRAYTKVTKVPQNILEYDGVPRIMSDSHTPLWDPVRKIFNTGKLAKTENLPNEPNTFLIFHEGRGQLMTINNNGTVTKFRRPLSCRALFD